MSEEDSDILLGRPKEPTFPYLYIDNYPGGGTQKYPAVIYLNDVYSVTSYPDWSNRSGGSLNMYKIFVSRPHLCGDTLSFTDYHGMVDAYAKIIEALKAYNKICCSECRSSC